MPAGAHEAWCHFRVVFPVAVLELHKSFPFPHDSHRKWESVIPDVKSEQTYTRDWRNPRRYDAEHLTVGVKHSYKPTNQSISQSINS